MQAAALYELAGAENGDPDGECYGSMCFQTTFLILGSLCAAGVLCSGWLARHSADLAASETDGVSSNSEGDGDGGSGDGGDGGGGGGGGGLLAEVKRSGAANAPRM